MKGAQIIVYHAQALLIVSHAIPDIQQYKIHLKIHKPRVRKFVHLVLLAVDYALQDNHLLAWSVEMDFIFQAENVLSVVKIVKLVQSNSVQNVCKSMI